MNSPTKGTVVHICILYHAEKIMVWSPEWHLHVIHLPYCGDKEQCSVDCSAIHFVGFISVIAKCNSSPTVSSSICHHAVSQVLVPWLTYLC